MNAIHWQLLAGLLGLIIYYIRRFDPKFTPCNGGVKYTFTAYLVNEWPAFVKGVVGFIVFWILWNFAQDYINAVIAFGGNFIGALKGIIVQLPELNTPVCLVLGYAGKPIYDLAPRVFSLITHKIKDKFFKDDGAK